MVVKLSRQVRFLEKERAYPAILVLLMANLRTRTLKDPRRRSCLESAVKIATMQMIIEGEGADANG